MRYFKVWFFILILLVSFNITIAADQRKIVAVVAADGIQRVKVVGGSYFFDPSYIVVKVKVPVELTVSKEPGVAPHDIIVSAPEAGMEIKENMGITPSVIKFTPTKTGIYPFYCGKKAPLVKSHRERGMEGTMEVTD